MSEQSVAIFVEMCDVVRYRAIQWELLAISDCDAQQAREGQSECWQDGLHDGG